MEESIKWNYVVSRPPTADELEIYGHEYIWDGVTPEEDEMVIVSDGKTTWVDMWVCHGNDDCNFDSDLDLKEFYWVSIPKPPIKEVE
ncbi:hypothetical protein [Globicatella sp. PHS-GS-PNBC-21-1553]|uniref:hypothetical protein n=1 Tax=Globicatella sp. PHS-GS-PNBC-21-1553 TaxID=2885764 RepID=UPI00298EF403|nr:hypothetical protein [Globicatella sp. PHS-GS-PNBC-21-1553]WPC07996.1 hypothetical protein LB888_08035 [Globicatella sp. PHS-GS-PNBC-21-1553]